MTKTHIRWGILGAGDVAEKKSGPGFQKAPNSELRAVMRRDPAKAEDFARRHGVPVWYSDAEALLADSSIDAVYIATPPVFHRDYAIAALKAGKNVYLEKPVTLNAAECDAILSAEAETGGKISAAHYRRFVPSFVKLGELLQAGAIGKPRLIQLDMLQPPASNLIAQTADNWRVNPALSGGGLFHDLAPHQLDLMLHWFGEPMAAQGFAANLAGLYPAADTVQGWALFPDQLVLQGRWHFAAPADQTRDLCEIIGSEGRIEINFFGQQIIRLENAQGRQTYELPNPEHIQQPMIEQVNRYFLGEGDNPCSVEEARSVMALMDRFSQPPV